MGNSQGFVSQLFNRKHYNDTPYDAISQVPLITIDREETLASKTPLTYIVTFPNNIEGSKAKLDEYFHKISEHHSQHQSALSNKDTKTNKDASQSDNRFNVLLVPVDDLSSLAQKPFAEIKQGLSEVIPADMKAKSTTLIKTNLRDSGSQLIKFIGYQTDRPFTKAANLFVSENFSASDPRSGKEIYQSKIQQID